MAIKKKLILNFRPSPKARFLLEKFGYISKRGNVICRHGALTDFINNVIVNSFENKAILEIEFPRFQIANKRKQIEFLRREIANLALQIQEVSDKRAEAEEFRKRLMKKINES